MTYDVTFDLLSGISKFVRKFWHDFLQVKLERHFYARKIYLKFRNVARNLQVQPNFKIFETIKHILTNNFRIWESFQENVFLNEWKIIKKSILWLDRSRVRIPVLHKFFILSYCARLQTLGADYFYAVVEKLLKYEIPMNAFRIFKIFKVTLKIDVLFN